MSRKTAVKKKHPGERGPGKKPAVYKHPLGPTWKSMKQRCEDRKVFCFPHYGGRGIVIHPEWSASFWSFASYIEKELGPRPSPKHTLDRVEKDGGYEPGNLRWATQKQQLRNTRRNRLVTHNGQVKCVSEWAEMAGLNIHVFKSRIFILGWDFERAMNTPIRKYASKSKRPSATDTALTPTMEQGGLGTSSALIEVVSKST